MVPEKKITVEDVKYVLSSHFQGTPYDPYAKHSDPVYRNKYRAIGINRTDLLSLIQIRPYMPEEFQVIQWVAFASNPFNVLVPFYPQVSKTPEYMANTTAEVSTENFYWASRMIAAMADAAYEIQKEEQRKTIEVTTANADIAKQEREIELKQKEVAVKEQALEAEVKKQAEADKYAAQQKADAALYQRQKEAEAKQFEAQRQAEARKAQAEADRFAKEQEAEGIRAVGEAEAAAIQAKGVAEAEAMEKKAEAYAKYNKAAVAEMMIKVLPDVAAKIAEPLGQIDKITIIGGDGGNNGVEQVAGNVPAVMAKLLRV